MIKKITALLLSGALMAGMTTAFAEAPAPVQTAQTVREYAAKAAEWNGKTAMKAGKAYVVTKNLTISKKVTLPKGATLTVKNGAKLAIGTKGTLNVKGTLTVAKGATLAVSGKLYEYKTGKLTVSGTASLGKKSNVTINGKLTVGSTGVIKGTPKSLTLAAVAATTIKGKNTCAKLAAAIDNNAISALLTDLFTLSLVDGDYYGAVKRAYPASYVEFLDGLFKEEGLSLKEYCAKYGEALKQQYADEGLDMDSITEVSVKINKTTTISSAKLKNYAALLNGAAPDKGYTANITLTAKTANGTKTDTSDVTCIMAGGEWYLIG